MGSLQWNLKGRNPSDWNQDTFVEWSTSSDYDHCFIIKDITTKNEIHIERGDAIKFLIMLFDSINWQSYEDIDLEYLSDEDASKLLKLVLNIPLKCAQYLRRRIKHTALESEVKSLTQERDRLICERKEIISHLNDLRKHRK